VTRRTLGLGAIGAAVTGLALPRLFRQSAKATSNEGYDISQSDDGRKKRANVAWIRPGGAGNRSGTDWHNAARLVDIDEMIQLVGPGGTVRLASDSGTYRALGPITISHGGAASNPVKIVGVDRAGKTANARIVGTRTSPYPTTSRQFAAMNHGKDVFRLNAGADHLHFSFLDFQNIGNGAFYVRATIADLTLEDIVATNVRRFFERAAGLESTITGLTVRRISVKGFSKSAFRLDHHTSNVLMEDVLGDSMRQDFDNFAEGVDISGNVHDAVFRRCIMSNSQQTRGPDDFWNGDGFTSERNTYNILFEDCVASGNTDAGFDLKSSAVTLLRCKAYDNTANFKLWGRRNVVMQECTSEDPVHRGGVQKARHLTAPGGANILVRNCTFTDENGGATVYHTEANDKADPPIGSTITVVSSTARTLGRLSFVDVRSRISIDGIEQPYDGR
jgi:hypothetical protein